MITPSRGGGPLSLVLSLPVFWLLVPGSVGFVALTGAAYRNHTLAALGIQTGFGHPSDGSRGDGRVVADADRQWCAAGCGDALSRWSVLDLRHKSKGSVMTSGRTKARAPLTRDLVLREAITLADEVGLSGLSMRRLGQRLGVEAMSLYNHVGNKDDLLDGMADLVSADFTVPDQGQGWREGLTVSACSAHAVLLQHPWAAVLLESRSNPGPQRLRYLNGVVGAMIEAGFPVELAYYGILTLDSYVYGFTVQEMAAPAAPEEAADSAEAFVAGLPKGEYPHLASMAQVVMDPAHDQAADFVAGLALVLDGFELRWKSLSEG